MVVFSLWTTSPPSAEALRILPSKDAGPSIQKCREDLGDRVPGYMIPRVWICVQAIPTTNNGKLHRREVQRWLETTSSETCEEILRIGRPSHQSRPTNAMEKMLQEAWGAVLGISQDMIDLNQTFYSLGGDSISAMQVVSRLRERGVRLAVHDILRYRTIAAIVPHAASTTPDNHLDQQMAAIVPEVVDKSFELTPIQKMHFKMNSTGQNHYNQSVLLRLHVPTDNVTLRKALHTIVDRHSMLRARYTLSPAGEWTQRIVGTSSPNLFRFERFGATELSQARKQFETSQRALDIVHGPLFSADLVDVVNSDEPQHLYLISHHLVMDIVSWKTVLEDLKMLLSSSTLPPKPLSFYSWALAQEAYAKKPLRVADVLQCSPPITTDIFTSWGLWPEDNVYATALTSTFSLDGKTTSALLAYEAAEPVEILIAALLCSFQRTIAHGRVPTLYSEGHGRQTDLTHLDISRIVGWFTVMMPIFLDVGQLGDNDIAQLPVALRAVKDARDRVPGKGWPYFVSRYLTPDGISTFEAHDEMEILFNYLGANRDVDGEGTPFTQVPIDLSNVNENVRRPALFDVTAAIREDCLTCKIQWSSKMQHQNNIRSWVSEFHSLLASAPEQISASELPAMCDYPLLSLDSYASLDGLLDKCTKHITLPSLETVESIHPCSPMQQGILIAQARAPELYNCQVIWKVASTSTALVKLDRLSAACDQVIARHQAFRTHFVEVNEAAVAFCQVVLQHVSTPISLVHHQGLEQFARSPAPEIWRSGKLPYALTICETANHEVYLRIDINHGLIDGTSTQIFVRDLVRAYSGHLDTPLPLYSDYIAYLAQASPRNSIDFWTGYLGNVGLSHFPVLNEDNNALVRPRFHTLSIDLPDQTSALLQSFCRKHNTTLANFMSLIWATVLRCYLGLDEGSVCFGYLASGRDVPVPRAEDIVGPMITMLIRKVEFTADVSLVDLLQGMQEDFARTMPHQHTSLAHLHHLMGLGSTPLFNTIVNMQRGREGTATAGGEIELLEQQGLDPSEYDIVFVIIDKGGKTNLGLNFWDRCISVENAVSLSRLIQCAITSVLTNPLQRLGDVDLTSASELARIYQWNSGVPSKVEDSIHHTIKRQIEADPQARAVYSTEPMVSLSYKEVGQLSSYFAKRLTDAGVGPGSLVPFCFPKSHYTVVAMLAIIKAGGACVALDPSFPVDRMASIITNSKALVALVVPETKEILRGLIPSLVEINGSALPSQFGPLESAPSECRPDDLAFVIFTSGSTGTPKGIAVEHGAFCTSASLHAPRLGLRKGSRVLQFAAHTYDLSIAEVFTTLMVGGCVCVPSDRQRLNGLSAFIQTADVDWMFLTPTMAAMVDPAQVPSVRTLVLGGEHATPGNFSAWSSRVRLINSYGPAECAIWTNSCVVTDADASTANIGGTMGMDLWVVDPRDHHKLQPIGAPGELVIGGPTLAREYLGDSIKTSRAFITHPKWAGVVPSFKSQRFYKSGDLVRYNQDGTLSFAGRKDTQVKVHGHRIELEDIEHHIRECQRYIEHVVVIVPSAGPFSGRLVAVVSFRDTQVESAVPMGTISVLSDKSSKHGTAQRITELRDGMEQRVPRHMLPQVWAPVRRLPQLASGKLDRRTTRAWTESIDKASSEVLMTIGIQSSTEKAADLPLSPWEEGMRKIWAEVLGLPENTISTSQSFLGLGGDSISAMQAVSRARAKDMHITVQDIFRLKSIGQITVHMQATNKAGVKPSNIGTRTEGATSSTSIFPLLNLPPNRVQQLISSCVQKWNIDKPEAIEDIFPCSHMQEGILTSQARSFGLGLYKICVDWQVFPRSASHTVDVVRLAGAWRHVVQRHQAFRSYFLEASLKRTSFVQVVLKEVEAPITVFQSPTLEDFKARDDLRSFDDNGLPYRVSLCSTPQGEVYCRLAISHAIDDGTSMQVVLRDVALAYEDMLPLGPVPLYGDFIRYIHGSDSGNANALIYWQKHLDGLEACLFPIQSHIAIAKPEGQSSRRLTHLEHRISGGQAAALNSICERFEVTVSDVFKVLWALMLRCYVGTDSVCFGYLTSGRDAPLASVQDIVGPLINMLVCRTVLNNAEATLVDLMKGTHEEFVQSLPHQHVPLQEVFHALGVGGQPLFNTCVNVQKSNSAFWIGDTPMGGLRFENDDIYDPSEYDVDLSVMLAKDQVTLLMNYWESSIPGEQAADIMSTIVQMVTSLIQNPNQRAHDLDLFSERNQKQLTTMWNTKAARLQYSDLCVHELFEAQAATQPQALAVDARPNADEEDPKSIWTYGHLNAVANKFAHHLRSLGVGPEIFVLFCVDRSPWAVVAVLAILKAGGAVVLMDPSNPEERMRKIIADTDATIAVCSMSQQDRLQHLQVLKTTLVVDQAIADTLPARTDNPKTLQPPGTPATASAALVVFTSGSTGTPKGVVLEHRNLSTYCEQHPEWLGLHPDSRVAHFASYTFDVSMQEILLTLARGACICVLSDEERLGGDLEGAFRRRRIDWADLTPTVARSLRPTHVPALRTLIIGGELVTDDLIEVWAPAQDTRLFNAYGPCECTITSSFTTARGLQPGDAGANIGKTNACVFVTVDPACPTRLVPVGTPGELVIGGPIVGRGYLRDEAKTAAAFLVDPPWASMLLPSVRKFYRTGDLAVLNRDGSVTYVGRKDNQVKLNGKRIELGEVEHCLARSQVTENVMALVPKAGSLKNRLIALVDLKSVPRVRDGNVKSGGTQTINVIATDGSSVLENLRVLHEVVENRLPTHMVPALIIPVEDFPRMATDKTDRRATTKWLERMSADTHRDLVAKLQNLSGVGVVEPKTDMEARLRTIWGEALYMNTENIGVNHDFFKIGGDSVVAMRMMARCRENGIRVSARDVFQQRTIKDLALRCTRIDVNTHDDSCYLDVASGQAGHEQLLAKLGLSASDVEEVYRCSPLQESILQLQSQPQSRRAWCSTWIMQVHSNMADRELGENVLHELARAWQHVVRRHPILRTIFASIDGAFHQLVLKNHEPSINIQAEETSHDRVENGGGMTSFKNWKQSEHTDGNKPPCRMTLAQRHDGQVFVKLELNHVLYDAVTMSIIWHDLQAAFVNRLPSTPGPRYGAFIEYLEREGARAASLAYWTSHLETASPCLFPPQQSDKATSPTVADTTLTKYPGAAPDALFQSVAVPLSTSQTARLRVFCRDGGFTLANVFQLLWALVVRRFMGIESDANDILFGVMLSGRDAAVPEPDATAGPFVNVLPCRVRLLGCSSGTLGSDDSSRAQEQDLGYAPVTIGSVLSNIQSALGDALMYQHCSLDEIRTALGGTSRAVGRQERLFNTFLNMQNVAGKGPIADSPVSFREVEGYMEDEVIQRLSPCSERRVGTCANTALFIVCDLALCYRQRGHHRYVFVLLDVCIA